MRRVIVPLLNEWRALHVTRHPSTGYFTVEHATFGLAGMTSIRGPSAGDYGISVLFPLGLVICRPSGSRCACPPGQPVADYPFTAPNWIPLIRYFCITTNSTIS